MDLYDAFAIFWRRKLVLSLSACIGIALALFVVLKLPETYTSVGLIVIDATGTGTGTTRVPVEWRVTTEQDAIASRAMFEGALGRLDIEPTYRLPTTFRPGLAREPSSDPNFIRAALLQDLGQRVTVGAAADSFVLRIGLKSADSRFNADFVNALMAEYISVKNARVRSAKAMVTDVVAGETAVLDERIDRAAAALGTIHAAPNTQAERTRLDQDIARLLALRDVTMRVEELARIAPDSSEAYVLSAAQVSRNGSSLPKIFVLFAILLATVGTTAVVLLGRDRHIGTQNV